MTTSSSSARYTFVVAALVFAASTLSPARSRADMPDAASLVDYGFKGFTLGLELGLAVGYITTGKTWEKNEWKKLVISAGIGALAGMSTGIVVSVADSTSGGAGGYYILRDAGYGTLLGGTMGALVGVLLWVDNGRPKDVLRGAAYGALLGAALGIVYGVVEASNSRGRDEYDDDDAALKLGEGWHLTVTPTIPDEGAVPGMAAVIDGRF